MYRKKIAAGSLLLAAVLMAVPPGTYTVRNQELPSQETALLGEAVVSEQASQESKETEGKAPEETGGQEIETETKPDSAPSDEGVGVPPDEETPKPGQEPEDKEPENQEPEDKEPENQEPENQEPENQEPESKEETPLEPEQEVEGDTASEALKEGETADLSGLEESAIHAGNGFYLKSLEEEYHLTIAEDFQRVMEEIEAEYRVEQGIVITGEELEENTADSQVDAVNWQDVVALYVLGQSQKGAGAYRLDSAAKEELAEIFGELNALVPQEDPSGNVILYSVKNRQAVTYEGLHVSELLEVDDVRTHKIYSEDERALLEKYSSSECLLLYTAATNADGFVNQSLEGQSEGQKAVVKAAYSLVGKISYFWGGKSTSIGWDERWGKATRITAGGSDDSGAVKEYGLDCSGYVSWAFLNGAASSGLDIQDIGAGTTGQWNASTAVTQEEARVGDLVFLQVPTESPLNHVGIVVGKTSAGDLVVAHCNSDQNGVTVDEAGSVGFQYVRRPNSLMSDEER